MAVKRKSKGFLSLAFILQTVLTTITPACVRAEVSANAILDKLETQIESQQIDDNTYTQLEKVLEADPNNYRAHLLLSNCYEKNGMNAQSLEEAKLAAASGATDPKTLVNLIKAQVRNGHRSIAMELLRVGMKKFPNDPDILYWTGNLALFDNKLSEAQQAYSIAMKDKHRVVGVATQLGEIQLRLKVYDKAIGYASMDLQQDPHYAPAFKVIGLAFMGMRRYDQAIGPLFEAFHASPYTPPAAYALAKSFAWLGQYENAIVPALFALQINASEFNENKDAKYLLLNCIKSSRWKDAKKWIDGACYQIDQSAIKRAQFHFDLADVLDRSGHHDEAIQQYQRCLQFDPQMGRAEYRLGRDVQLYKHDYEGALKHFEKAKQLRPEDEQIGDALIDLQMRLLQRHEDVAWAFKDWLRTWLPGWH